MAPNFISIISTVLQQSVDDIYSDSRLKAVATELMHTQEGRDKLSSGYVTTMMSAGLGAIYPQFHQHNKHLTTQSVVDIYSDARLKAVDREHLHGSANEGSQVLQRTDDNVPQRVGHVAAPSVLHEPCRSVEAPMANANYSDFFAFPVLVQEAFHPVAVGEPLGEHTRHLLHHCSLHIPHAPCPCCSCARSASLISPRAKGCHSTSQRRRRRWWACYRCATCCATCSLTSGWTS